MTLHSSSARLALFAAAAVLLLAAALYLIGAGRVSFWEDESWMALAVRGDLPSVWTFATERGVHPPLYFLLGWFYTRFTGDGEIALRWLAGLCALVGLAWTYRLTVDTYGRRAALYALVLAAGSLFLIYFARIARHYTLFFALSAALAVVYLRYVSDAKHKNSPQRRTAARDNLPLIIIAVLQAALLYTHYFGVWMALVVGLHALLVLPRRDTLRVWAALIVGGLLFLPWLPAILAQFGGAGSGLGYVSRDLLLNLRAYLDRIWNGDYLLGGLLSLMGIIAVWQRRRARPGALLMLLWLTLPLTLSLLLNLRFSWFIERNMIFTLAGLYALMGAGLAWAARLPFGRFIAPLIVLAFIVLGIARYDTFWPFITPDWRSLAGAISNDARPDDLFVLNGEPYSLPYYLDQRLPAPITLTRLNAWLDTPTENDRIWLIDANWEVRPQARAALPAGMQMTRKHVLGVLVAEFYQRLPDAPRTTFGDQIELGVRLPDALNATPGTALHLDLWWRALRQPDADYSVGVYLVDAGGTVVSQQDGGFDQGRIPALLLPLNQWTPDSRALPIPAALTSGPYTLTVAVYDWRTNERLIPVDGLPNRAFELATLYIP
ncbi:MAG: glycosyltransferase family 39 protein [Anaerolineae bacterium]|nr:glycosyltransferase family 39 protein [Anaerolineae bacterium]